MTFFSFVCVFMFGVLDLIGASCIYFFKKNLYLIDFVSNYVCVCVRERKRERERESTNVHVPWHECVGQRRVSSTIEGGLPWQVTDQKLCPSSCHRQTSSIRFEVSYPYFQVTIYFAEQN